MKALAEQGAVALVPIGSTEAHGPHLPLSVDVLIAEAVCARVATALGARGQRAVLFPSLAYGLTEFAAGFSGTVSIAADAFRAYLTEVLAGIAGHGFRTVRVVNHHLEPAHFALVHEAARLAAERTGADILAPDHRKRPTSEQLGEEFVRGGSHAGLYETSLMLAVAPNLVDEAARRALPDLPINLPAAIKAGARNFEDCGGTQAYFGAPASATPAEGERLLTILADLVVASIQR
jgi:creatinine amidohydrolase